MSERGNTNAKEMGLEGEWEWEWEVSKVQKQSQALIKQRSNEQLRQGRDGGMEERGDKKRRCFLSLLPGFLASWLWAKTSNRTRFIRRNVRNNSKKYTHIYIRYMYIYIRDTYIYKIYVYRIYESNN